MGKNLKENDFGIISEGESRRGEREGREDNKKEPGGENPAAKMGTTTMMPSREVAPWGLLSVSLALPLHSGEQLVPLLFSQLQSLCLKYRFPFSEDSENLFSCVVRNVSG